MRYIFLLAWDSPFLDGEGGGSGGEGWAQFIAEAFSQPAADPFAPLSHSAPSAHSAPAPLPLPERAEGGGGGFGAEEEFGSARETRFTPYWGAGEGNFY